MGLKALVITPTTGAKELEDAIISVQKQDTDTDHLIVCDGDEFKDKVDLIIKKVNHPKLKVCYLPYNTGGGGFYGHRVMAGFSHLVNHEFLLFLDQDNWYEPDHVSTMVEEITKNNLDWSYSLRKVYDKDRFYVCDDNCESLGKHPVWFNDDFKDDIHLIDSSCYCFKTEFFRQVGHIWDWGWGADRRFYAIIKDHIKHINYGGTGKHTLCYRLGGNEGSVTADFFIRGNEKMMEKYKGNFPWVVA